MKSSNVRLSSILNGKNSNLYSIKFVAAVMVIIAHAFPLSVNRGDVLSQFTKQIGFGYIAVCTFFFFSGLYISISYEKRNDIKAFFRARILRIFPPLIIVNFFTAFVLGPFFTELSLKDYYIQGGVYKYLLNSCLILVHELPGVFSNNTFGAAVNGALWTLPLEFLCYIALFCAYKIGLSKNKTIGIVMSVLVFLVTLTIIIFIPSRYSQHIQICLVFYIGMITYTLREKIIINSVAGMLCMLGLLVCAYFKILAIGIVFLLPYILLVIVFLSRQHNNLITRLGKYSYCLYLCGFPIQQSIVSLYGGNMNPYINILIAIPISIVFAIFITILSDKIVKVINIKSRYTRNMLKMITQVRN